MNAIRISIILCYIYFVYGKTYLTSFTRQYVQDEYHCSPQEVSFDNLSMNYDVVSCLLHCGHTSGCLSVSYDNVTKRCVGCQSFIDTNNTAGDSSLLVFEKQDGSGMTTTSPSVTTTTPPLFSCPPDDTIFRTVQLSDGEHFTYKIVKTNATQSGAIEGCTAQGGFLSRVKTVAKMNMLLQILRNCPGYSGVEYYVDGSNANATDFYSPDAWTFIDDDPVPMTSDFWGPGYPNNPHIAHCLRMQYFIVNYLLDDCSCDLQCYYICEK